MVKKILISLFIILICAGCGYLIFRPIKPENPEEPKIITYLVEFKDEQSGEIIFSQEIEKNNPLNEIPVAPEKTGYWFVDFKIDGETVDLNELIINRNLTIVLNYSDMFAYSFESDGEIYLSGSCKYGSTLAEIKPEDPTKDGYKFIGWTLNGELVSDSYIFKGRENFVAVFEEITVTIDLYLTETQKDTTTIKKLGENFWFPIMHKTNLYGNKVYKVISWVNTQTGEEFPIDTTITVEESHGGIWRAKFILTPTGTFTCSQLVGNEDISSEITLNYDLETNIITSSKITEQLTVNKEFDGSMTLGSTSYTVDGVTINENLSANYNYDTLILYIGNNSYTFTRTALPEDSFYL